MEIPLYSQIGCRLYFNPKSKKIKPLLAGQQFLLDTKSYIPFIFTTAFVRNTAKLRIWNCFPRISTSIAALSFYVENAKVKPLTINK